MTVHFERWKKEKTGERNYISWEMTPTSIGGEKQAGISGGSQSPS